MLKIDTVTQLNIDFNLVDFIGKNNPTFEFMFSNLTMV